MKRLNHVLLIVLCMPGCATLTAIDKRHKAAEAGTPLSPIESTACTANAVKQDFESMQRLLLFYQEIKK